MVFAELRDPVRKKIERHGLTCTIDPRHFFPAVGAAVGAVRAETGAQSLAASHGASTQHGQPTPLTGGNRDGREERQE